MTKTTRRTFLGGLGQGMLIAGIGSHLANDLGFALMPEGAEDLGELDFGELEPLVALMQETAPSDLLPILTKKLEGGVTLKTLVAAGALANARTFGGQDYEGYHAMMALSPAYELSRRMTGKESALPVLKVLYRNTARMQTKGGRKNEALSAIAPHDSGSALTHSDLHAAMRGRDFHETEAVFAGLCQDGPEAAYEDLQYILQETLDVHRVVLAWRSYEILELTGREHALTMLRQSVRFCVADERRRVGDGRPEPVLRTLLPELIEQHGLAKKTDGEKTLDDAGLLEWGDFIADTDKSSAARFAAEKLGEGYRRQDVGEALSLAANQLLLRDPGRRQDASYGRKKGSVHGASVGVHASDAARAWRNIAAITADRNAAASLIAGAYHTAGQSQHVRKDRFPYRELKPELKVSAPEAMLHELRLAIESGDQARATAFCERYCEANGSERDLMATFLRYAVSQDGALHAEKYYRTVAEDSAASRARFKTNHYLALARVSASAHGIEAPGLAQARELIGV